MSVAMRKIYLAILLSFTTIFARSQGLLAELDSTTPEPKQYVTGTFKGVRIINGQSVEMPGKGEMIFMIQHRFGSLRGGIVDLLGLDLAGIRFGLEYTLPFYQGRICVGIGRSNYLKVWDGFVKYQIFRQSKGPKSFPFTIDLYGSVGISTLNYADPARNNFFSSRMSYCFQILWARKFCRWFSFQLTPTVCHQNLVPLKEDQNTTVHLGFSGKFRISNRIAISAEYFWPIAGQNFANVNNLPIKGPLSFGVDWETGGHVFQFFLSNSMACYDNSFIAGTTNDWLNGDIHFGFNMQRTFSFKKGAAKKYKVKPD
jgi:hypothetical protein